MTASVRKIAKIRTGGQSGVDRTALDFAIEHEIPYCGWCPKGGWAEDYPDPPGLLRDYPELQETPSSGTEQRTKWNMRDADAILTIIPESSAESKGTEVGLEEGEHLGKPMFTLCVGGPRASECPEAYETAKAVLTAVLPVFDTSGRQAE